MTCLGIHRTQWLKESACNAGNMAGATGSILGSGNQEKEGQPIPVENLS